MLRNNGEFRPRGSFGNYRRDGPHDDRLRTQYQYRHEHHREDLERLDRGAAGREIPTHE